MALNFLSLFLLRSLMPGDIVRKISDKTPAERGFCRNVHVDSTVEIVGTKQVNAVELWYSVSDHGLYFYTVFIDA